MPVAASALVVQSVATWASGVRADFVNSGVWFELVAGIAESGVRERDESCALARTVARMQTRQG
jgi:hypothetical protein